MKLVNQRARFVPFDAMASLIEVPAATAWRYDQDVLEADLPAPDLDGLNALLVDEKNLGRGHGYVTLVLNGRSGELLFMNPGKKSRPTGSSS